MRLVVVRNGMAVDVQDLSYITAITNNRSEAIGTATYQRTNITTGATESIPYEVTFTADEGCVLYDSADAQPGWLLTDGVFSAPLAAPAEPPPVPQSVTPLQIRKAIRQLGLKSAADAFLATVSEEAQEEWEYCLQVDRDNVFIVAAAVALEKTEEELDDIFRLASTLTPS